MSILDTDGLPFFAKGSSFSKRAEIVMQKSRGRVTVSLDMSSFDNSIRGGIYKGEIRAFSRMFGFAISEDDFIKPLIQLSNDPDDIVTGLPVRKSGDVQTGSGNCMVMYWFATKIQAIVPEVNFYCDGDDTLMFMPPEVEYVATKAA